MQTVDKNRIQDNIGTGTDQDGGHAETCESLCRNKKIQAQSQHDKNRSGNINLHIRQRIDNCLFTAAEEPQQRFTKNPEKYTQDNGFNDQDNETVIQDPVVFGCLILPHADGGSWGTALTDQC